MYSVVLWLISDFDSYSSIRVGDADEKTIHYHSL